MKMTIRVLASEKLNAGQYESLERSVSLSADVEVGEDGGELPSILHDLQMRAEAQLYAALSRGMTSRGQPMPWLRTSAIDRADRIGNIETIAQQSTATVAEDRGVIR